MMRTSSPFLPAHTTTPSSLPSPIKASKVLTSSAPCAFQAARKASLCAPGLPRSCTRSTLAGPSGFRCVPPGPAMSPSPPTYASCSIVMSSVHEERESGCDHSTTYLLGPPHGIHYNEGSQLQPECE